MQFAGTLTPPAFPREYPYASAGSPHPARACGRGYPCTSANSPHPSRASVEIPIHSLPSAPIPPAPAAKDTRTLLPATPTPLAPSAKDTRTLLPAAPAPPAPAAKDTHTLLPAAPTPLAPAALLPRPLPGAGSVRGDIRGAAVPGVEPAGNRIRGVACGPPCPALLRDLPMCWTVGISPRGRGRRGGGTCSPSPVFHAPTILLLCRQPSSRPR